MYKFRQILAATDFSAPARHAVERAASVAGQTGAALTLLHVANLGPLEKMQQWMMSTSINLKARLLERAHDELERLGAALQQGYGVAAGCRVNEGVPLSELIRSRDALGADLFVCGARGESFVRHLLLGSTAARMVSGASGPILVVKETVHEPYRTLLVPVDFSPASLSAVRCARAIAPRAELILLHVFDLPFEGHLRYAGVDEETIQRYRIAARQDALRQLHELSDAAGLPIHSARLIVVHGHPVLRIIEQEQELNCDLIVMGKHGENIFEDLLLGSVTKRVLSESQCDVLISV